LPREEVRLHVEMAEKRLLLSFSSLPTCISPGGMIPIFVSIPNKKAETGGRSIQPVIRSGRSIFAEKAQWTQRDGIAVLAAAFFSSGGEGGKKALPVWSGLFRRSLSFDSGEKHRVVGPEETEGDNRLAADHLHVTSDLNEFRTKNLAAVQKVNPALTRLNLELNRGCLLSLGVESQHFNLCSFLTWIEDGNTGEHIDFKRLGNMKKESFSGACFQHRKGGTEVGSVSVEGDGSQHCGRPLENSHLSARQSESQVSTQGFVGQHVGGINLD